MATVAMDEGTEATDLKVTEYRRRLRSAAEVIEKAVTG
jgi:hypothetical protein